MSARHWITSTYLRLFLLPRAASHQEKNTRLWWNPAAVTLSAGKRYISVLACSSCTSHTHFCYLWTVTCRYKKKSNSLLRDGVMLHRISSTINLYPLDMSTCISYHFSSAPPWGPDSGLLNSPQAPCHSSLQTPRPPSLSVRGQFLIQERLAGFVATINKQLKVSLISSPPAPLQHWLQYKSHTDPEHKQPSQHKARN